MRRGVILGIFLVFLIVLGAWLMWTLRPREAPRAAAPPADVQAVVDPVDLKKPAPEAEVAELPAVAGDAPGSGLELPGGAQGQVVELATGRGIAGAEVTIGLGKASGFQRAPVIVARSTTDASGHWTVPGLPPGSYEVRRMPVAGFRDLEAAGPIQVQVDAGARAEVPRFELVPGLNIEAVVRTDMGPVPADARVRWRRAGMEEEEMRPAARRADGVFVVAGLSPGEPVELLASAPGHLSPGPALVSAVEAPQPPVELYLVPGVPLRGMVLSPERTPVAGAEIQYALLPHIQTTSNERGEFAFDALLPMECVLSVQGEIEGVHHGAMETLDLSAGLAVEHLEIILTRAQEPFGVEDTAHIRGRLVNGQGGPVEGAEVSLLSPDTNFIDHQEALLLANQYMVPGSRKEAISDEDGRFSIAVADADQVFRARVVHPDYLLQVTDVLRTHGEATVVLEESRRVRGRVVDAASGRAIPAFSVRVEDIIALANPQGMESRQVSDAEGRFEVRSVWPGAFKIQVSADTYGTAVEQVDPAQQGDRELEIRLSPGRTISGVVVDPQGSPVALASVKAVGQPSNATSDAAGRFVLEQLSGDTHTVMAYHADYLPGEAQVQSFGASDVVVALRGASRLLIRLNGEPGDSAAALTLSPRLMHAEGGAYWGSPDSEGWLFQPLPPGRYTLTVGLGEVAFTEVIIGEAEMLTLEMDFSEIVEAVRADPMTADALEMMETAQDMMDALEDQ